MRFQALRVFVVAMIPTMAPVVAGQSSIQGLTVWYEAPRSLGLHEPVVVKLIVENSLSEAVQFDLGADRTDHLRVEAKDPSGQQVVGMLPARGSGTTRRGRLSVAAGARFSQQIVLNEWLSFDQIGNYDVNIRPQTQMTTTSGNALNVRVDGAFRVRVTPRDDRQLQQVCAGLLNTIRNRSNVEASLDAAKAFRYIVDPVAIPFAKDVLAATDSYDRWILGQLLRIGTVEALAVVEAESGSQNKGRADLARGILDNYAKGRQ